MPVCDQSETICFLGSSQAFGDGETAKVVTTHISTVLLLGSRALKLKRAVKLPYVDLSTPERRLAMCERELKLNRRMAPELYRAVHRVTREPNGELALNGEGELVDAVLEMKRFDDELLFDRLAQHGRLSPADMAGLAAALAELHRVAEVSRDEQGARRVERVLAVNERAFAAAGILPAEEVQEVNAACRAALARHAGLLDQRAREGKVRLGHGDLHLRNICLIDDKPMLFDCLEFDEDLATTDILYDLAFALMDLWHRGLEACANALFNRYLDMIGDESGLGLLPFFMAIRAAVRAHVAAADVARPPTERLAEAQAYLRLCRAFLAVRVPVLIAVGGYSGSGKSTVAAGIAAALGPVPGARIAASDRIRKKLCGVAPETRLPPEGYTDEVSDRTYAEMARVAGAALAQGHAAIADAVFDRQAERDRIAEVAQRAGVPFHGLWLEAPERVLVERVSARRRDPSDATPDIVMGQLARKGAASEWTELASQGERSLVVAAALGAVGVRTVPPTLAPPR